MSLIPSAIRNKSVSPFFSCLLTKNPPFGCLLARDRNRGCLRKRVPTLAPCPQMLASAETGTGKTGAFALALLQRVQELRNLRAASLRSTPGAAEHAFRDPMALVLVRLQ